MLILPVACLVAVRKLWMKQVVIHRGICPLLYHRVIGRAQVGFSTGLSRVNQGIGEYLSARRVPT